MRLLDAEGSEVIENDEVDVVLEVVGIVKLKTSPREERATKVFPQEEIFSMSVLAEIYGFRASNQYISTTGKEEKNEPEEAYRPASNSQTSPQES